MALNRTITSAETGLASSIIDALGRDFVPKAELLLELLPEELPAVRYGHGIDDVDWMVHGSLHDLREDFLPVLVAPGENSMDIIMEWNDRRLTDDDAHAFPCPAGIILPGAMAEVSHLIYDLRARLLKALQLCTGYEGVNLDAIAEYSYWEHFDSLAATFFSKLGFTLRRIAQGLTLILLELVHQPFLRLAGAAEGSDETPAALAGYPQSKPEPEPETKPTFQQALRVLAGTIWWPQVAANAAMIAIGIVILVFAG